MFGVMMCVTASAAVISSMMAFASSSSTHEILLRAALAQTVMMVEPMAPFTSATQPSRRGSWRGSFVTVTGFSLLPACRRVGMVPLERTPYPHGLPKLRVLRD